MSGLQNGRDPTRGDYDWRAFATALKHRQTADGRGLRALADEAGVTLPDLSRALGGQIVSTGKVFALCDWLGRDARDFYLPPESFGKTQKNQSVSAGQT